MKKFLLILVALVFANVLSAQNSDSRLHVRKIELIPNDTEASRAKKIDENREKCALIKIQTPNMDEAERNKLVIDADRGTFVYPEPAVGELKIFLTQGVKILVIKHPDYGVLNYEVKEHIEGNKVYKLVLEADKSVQTGPQTVQINSNWVVVKMKPADAVVTIDGKLCSNGKAMLSTDEPHELVATHPYYHTFEKTINASANEKMTYSFEMAPAFGWLIITSKPENGATVLINNKKVGVTPYRSDTLASGEYEVTLLKDMYETETRTVNVRDKNEGEIEIPMKATFAEIKIVTDNESDIYVDDTPRGKGTWTGRLGEGEHIVEARKTSHRNSIKKIDVVAGRNESVTVANPVPIYGALNLNSTPDEAFVYLDGVKIGETPLIKNNVLIGPHTLKFEKQGCAPLTKTITVAENQMLNVDEKLVTGREISISTDKNGDKIFVDGKYVGDSPMTATLSFGEHEVKAARDGKETSKKITVAQNGGTTSVQLSFELENKTFTVNGVSFEMIAVKGGTFTMGCTSEQGGDCDSDEEPAHSVTLSDYYIGKFEVTIGQFRAFINETNYRTDADKEGWAWRWMQVDGQWKWNKVNGINWMCDQDGNVRNSSEDNHPVLYVSCNDAMEFCKWLSRKTGFDFRLPTEAEWEYAARGGNKSRGYKYSGSNSINDIAWYGNLNSNTTANGKTHPIGTKSPNELGIYDMSGNVWEWCQDWYGNYSSGSQTNPTGPATGSRRVRRGGSWNSNAKGCRVSNRRSDNPGNRYNDLGFRLAADK